MKNSTYTLRTFDGFNSKDIICQTSEILIDEVSFYSKSSLIEIQELVNRVDSNPGKWFSISKHNFNSIEIIKR
jgi:thymidine kinase